MRRRNKKGKVSKARLGEACFSSVVNWTERPLETFLVPHFKQPVLLFPLSHFYVPFFLKPDYKISIMRHVSDPII